MFFRSAPEDHSFRPQAGQVMTTPPMSKSLDSLRVGRVTLSDDAAVTAATAADPADTPISSAAARLRRRKQFVVGLR